MTFKLNFMYVPWIFFNIEAEGASTPPQKKEVNYF